MPSESDSSSPSRSSSHGEKGTAIWELLDVGLTLALAVAIKVLAGDWTWDWIALPVTVASVWLIMVLFGAGGIFAKKRS